MVASAMFMANLWSDEDKNVLQGVCRGFKVVDGQPDVAYRVQNYKLVQGKISDVHDQPECVHALGAIRRPDGWIRPTPCVLA